MRRIAYALVRSTNPTVVLAEDESVLTRAIALEVVAESAPASLEPYRPAIQSALLEERWVDAVKNWMLATGIEIDAYPGERVWDSRLLDAESTALELRMKPIFSD